jgi:serine-type D-Ala-D-Ala carboxypeptidase (penicillin-binding protein 5/6)
MNRTILIAGLCLAVAGWAAPAQAQILTRSNREAVATDAAAWLIADTSTGVVLDSANAGKRLQIGSITKIATAMVLLDWSTSKGENLNQMATVPGTVAALNSPNSIGLAPGDQISLRDALYAALMQSDNQAAETIAVHVGRQLGGGASDQDSSRFFVAQMNALGRQIGMRDTRFLNPHGLDDLENKLPYSTAQDVALLANYALSHGGFTFYTSQKERRVTWQTAGGEASSALVKNTNEALGEMSIDGLKTGTTRKAGACVVLSAAQRPDSKQVGDGFEITPRRLTVVVLGSARRFEVGKALLARGWNLHGQWTQAGRPAKGWKSSP